MKKFRVTAVALLLALSLTMVFIVGCTDVAKFTVTVTGGDGGGEYTAESECTVTAALEEGKQFVRWIDGEGEEVSTADPYTFKVTGNTELTAVTADKTKYTVTINGGVITGTSDKTATVYEGQTVSVTAPKSQSRIFKSWLINGTDTSTENPYVFTATKDTEIVAVVDEICLIAVSGGSVDGQMRKKFKMGEECTIKADEAPAGERFAYWSVIDEKERPVIVSHDSTYTFKVTETEKYYAKFGQLHTVNVEGGHIASEKGEPQTFVYLEGDTCTVKPNVPEGFVFVEWQVDGVSVSTSAEYPFEVTKDVSLKAVFRSIMALEKLVNDNNQMLRHKNDFVIELDRMGTTAFTENVDHVMFYIYTSTDADKSDYVGRFILDNKDGWRLATVEGRKVIALEGSAGNLWKETKNAGDPQDIWGNSPTLNKQIFSDIMKLFIGESYDRAQPYYLAAQACAAEGSGYISGEISDIGSQSFID